MRKTRISYNSSVDALVAVAKRLSLYEKRYNMDSEEFFHEYSEGAMEDCRDYMEWSNDYQHYVELKFEIERQLRHAA